MCSGAVCLGPAILLSEKSKSTNCNEITAKVFPDINKFPNYAEFGYLPGDEFWRNLVANGDYTLVPSCYAKSTMKPNEINTASGTSTSTEEETTSTTKFSEFRLPLLVEAVEGEVSIKVGVLGSMDAGATQPTGQLTHQLSPLPGLRLTSQSAKDLKDVGGCDTTNDVFLVMHAKVDAFESDDTPDSLTNPTFVWTTRDMHLSLSPAFLTMVGADSLTPSVKKVAVHFTDGGPPYVSGGAAADDETLLTLVALAKGGLALAENALDSCKAAIGSGSCGVLEGAVTLAKKAVDEATASETKAAGDDANTTEQAKLAQIYHQLKVALCESSPKGTIVRLDGTTPGGNWLSGMTKYRTSAGGVRINVDLTVEWSSSDGNVACKWGSNSGSADANVRHAVHLSSCAGVEVRRRHRTCPSPPLPSLLVHFPLTLSLRLD